MVLYMYTRFFYMLDTILPLAQKLIAIKSIPDNQKALGEVLAVSLKQLKGYKMECFERNGVRSVLLYNTKTRPTKFKIILNAHLDVIPGKEYQYIPQVKGNRLYGVGSMDMKANAACLITVFKEMAQKVSFPLGLQLVTDEEIGGFDGTQYQIEKGVRADFVIAGEPTNFDVVYEAKGILQLKISSKGKTAHGAYPWRGKNAIWEMYKFLEVLQRKYPVPNQETKETTINVSNIETHNTVFNKIPDDCMVWLDIRFNPKEEKTILKNIKRIIPVGFSSTILAFEPALATNKNNRYLKTLKEITEQTIGKDVLVRSAHGSSDARHFARVHCPGVEFGSIGGDIGGDKEWVDISSLEKYYQILKKFLFTINKQYL